MNELDIFNEYECSLTQPDYSIINNIEKENIEIITATDAD